MSGRDAPPVIAVVGAATTVGRRIAAVLAEGVAAAGDGRTVVCVGPKRVPIEGASWRIVDVRDPALPRKFAQVDAVVLAHVDSDIEADRSGVINDPAHAVGEATDALFDALADSGVQQVVLLSSAMVVGAIADHAVPLPEDTPPRVRSGSGLVTEWVHAEQRLTQWVDAGDARVGTVLRPGVIVGPGVDTALNRHFEAPRVAVIDDDRPPWSLTHVDDLASAAAFVLTQRAAGTFAVASAPWISQQRLMEVLGKRVVRVPSALAQGALDRLHRVGMSSTPADDLSYIRYPWVLDPQGLAALGWTPTHSTDEVAEALAEQISGRTTIVGRRVGRSEVASIGAAGAAAAVLGAAAIVRARRQRG